MCYRIYKGQYQSAEEMAIHVYGCIKQYLILERALEGKEHLVNTLNYSLHMWPPESSIDRYNTK